MVYGREDFRYADIDRLTQADFLKGIIDVVNCAKDVLGHYKKLNETPPEAVIQSYKDILMWKAEIENLVTNSRLTKKVRNKAYGLMIYAQAAGVSMIGMSYKHTIKKNISFKRGKKNGY